MDQETPDDDEEDDEEEEFDRVHVVLDEDQASEAPEDSHRLAKVNASTDDERRAPVPMLAEGPNLHAPTGRMGHVGKKAPEADKAESHEQARKGERAEQQDDEVREEVEEQKAAAAGSVGEEQRAEASGPRPEEARLAGGREGDADEGRGARVPNPPSAGTDTPAIEEDAPSTVEAPDGWQPTVVFDPSLGMPAPNLIEDTIPEDTPVQDDELEQARGTLQQRTTGNDGQADEKQLATQAIQPTEELALAELDVEGADTPKTAPGWQGEAVVKETSRSAVSGEVEMQGQIATTRLTTPEEEVAEGDRSSVNAVAHPHAAYMDELDAVIRAAWLESIPVEYKAVGMQGVTTVRFEVDAKGRVVGKEVVRRSGYAELDALALDAIPKRLPRPPEDAADPTFVHQLNFRQTDHWAGGL